MVDNSYFFAGLPECIVESASREECKGYIKTVLYRLKGINDPKRHSSAPLLNRHLLEFYRHLCHEDFVEAYRYLRILGAEIDFICVGVSDVLIKTISSFVEE